MNNTLEIAALSMQADMNRLTTISQNLANAATPGYKRVLDVRTPFAGVLDSAEPQAGGSTSTDFASGSLRHTGQTLDLLVDGGAFLELRSEQNALSYVRSGSFQLDASGRVVSAGGTFLQLTSGDFKTHGSDKELRIDERGNVQQASDLVGQLRIVRFDAPEKLEPAGAGVFRAGAARIVDDTAAASVKSGYTEASNVQSTQEMVRLLETSRHFEAIQRVVQGYDEVMGAAIRKLGEV